MKLIVCAIKDHAIDAFLAPWYTRTQSEAIRQFQQACTQLDTPMARAPSDYDLFSLGIWDDHTGKTENHDAPQLIARGSNTKANGDLPGHEQRDLDLARLRTEQRN